MQKMIFITTIQLILHDDSHTAACKRALHGSSIWLNDDTEGGGKKGGKMTVMAAK